MLNVRVELRGELLEKFLKIQSHLGIESATEIMRYLIAEYYRKNIEPEVRRKEKKALEKEVGEETVTGLEPGERIPLPKLRPREKLVRKKEPLE